MVVVAILAVLIAILMPAVAAVRRAAMNAVCSSRLRELTHACILYRNEYGRLPSPAPSAPPGSTPDVTPFLNLNLPILGLLRIPGLSTPEDIHTDLLNSLSRYLRFPSITGDTIAMDLPPSVQCPTVEDEEVGRDMLYAVQSPVPSSPATVAYYTGFAYIGRLGEGSAAGNSLRVLRPERPASPKNSGIRAVLWADDVHWTSLGGGTWRFAHRRPNPEAPGALPFSSQSPHDLMGQHRAYTDGSVEWINASAFEFDDRSPSGNGERASLEISTVFRWWF